MKAHEQPEAGVPDVAHRHDPSSPDRADPGTPMTRAGAVALQRLAGNQAVVTALQREEEEEGEADEAYADEEPQARPMGG